MESTTGAQDFRSTYHPAPSNDNRRHAPLSRPAFPSGTVARIHRPCRSAMSSGPARPDWRLEFEPRCPPVLDPLMGWTGSRDPLRQVSLSFPTLDAALSYAERQGLRAVVQHDAQSRADERDTAKRAFSDGTLQRLGLSRLQDRYGNAMADAGRAEDEPRRQSGDSPLDVVRRSDLSIDDKRSILMNWAFDEYLVQQRQGDAAARSRLSEIEQAFLMLEGRACGAEDSHASPRHAA
jgi:hypothetical protein